RQRETWQRVYRDRVGGAPPDQVDATSDLYRKYYDVYMNRVLDVWRRWQTVVTEHRPDSVYVGNLGGGIRTVKNVKRLGEVARWFNADHQGRGGDIPIWDCAQQGRVAQSVMAGRCSTGSAARLRTCGGRPWAVTSSRGSPRTKRIF